MHVALGYAAGDLAQRLAHEPRVQPHVTVAHFAFQFGPRHQRGDTVHHQHVDGAGADQSIGDFQRLLTGIGLADQQIVQIDAKLAGIGRVQRMFGVNERTRAAALLRLSDHMQRQCRLAGTFRSVDLDDPPARQPADAKRHVQAERAGADDVDILTVGAGAHAHDRALAESPFDLSDGGIESF